MITVVGLGFHADSLTLRGRNKINGADKVMVRTALSAPGKAIGCDSFDYLYESAPSFDALNAAIADKLIELGENRDLVYCVDGDGYKDSSVIELAKRTRIDVIAGPFDIGMTPSTSCVYLSAYDIAEGFYPDPKMPVCVYGVDDKNMAGDVKLFLLRFYSPQTKIVFADGKGSAVIELADLDRQKKYSSDTAICIEGGNNSSFADLLRIMTRLTAPNGCPWDKAQTHESIRINLLEEAYEAVDAITNGNIEGMIEELGDVLLQVVFHCDIALRSGEFTLDDVIKGLSDKLISRHTHIFGGDKAESADGALSVWEKNKMKEKHQKTFSAAVNDIPQCFPALLRAQKAAKRMAKGGWTLDSQTALRLVKEKLENCISADGCENPAAALGEALMYLAYIAWDAGLDAEQALLDVVSKAQTEYEAFEKAVLADKKDVLKLTDAERKEYYERIKIS